MIIMQAVQIAKDHICASAAVDGVAMEAYVTM